MRKGELTREHIIEQAAALFNQKGYAGASLADIMEATGLKKGGIYRHFESKEALAVEAFDHSVRTMGERFAEAMRGREGAVERLMAIASVYQLIPDAPPVPGGCPILSAAAENDYGNPVLRGRVRGALDGLRSLVRRTVHAGVESGELRPGIDPDEVASVFTSILEGSVMLAQLYSDGVHVERGVAHLRSYLESLSG